MGVGMVLVGLTPSDLLGMALVAIALTGVMTSLVDGPISAIIQAVVTPDMQGRVISVMVSVGSLVVPLGMLFSGLFADRFGAPLLFLIAGVVCLAGAGWSFSSKDVLGLEVNTPAAPAASKKAAAADPE